MWNISQESPSQDLGKQQSSETLGTSIKSFAMSSLPSSSCLLSQSLTSIYSLRLWLSLSSLLYFWGVKCTYFYISFCIIINNHQQSFLRYGVSGGTPPSSIFSLLGGMARSTYLIYNLFKKYFSWNQPNRWYCWSWWDALWRRSFFELCPSLKTSLVPLSPAYIRNAKNLSNDWP